VSDPISRPEPGEKRPGWTRRYRRWLVDAGLVLAVYVGVQLYHTRDAPHGAAPPISGALLSGQAVDLSAYAGKPVLLHFWATWCSICRLERGSIESIAGDYPVLAVASQSGTAAEVAAYAREHGLKVPVLIDEDGALAARYGVKAFPSSFVIDGEGKIHNVEVGYTTELGLRLRLWWAGI